MRLRLSLLLALLAPSVACDQATKALAVTHLRGAPPLELLDAGVFARLVYAENPGAFLGLGRALPDPVRTAVFSIGVLALLVGLAVVLVRGARSASEHNAFLRGRLAPLGLALILAGGVGNLIDRVARPGGRVVDFAQLGLRAPPLDLRTGVFNVADLYIVAGAGIMFVATVRRSKPRPA